MRNLITSSFFYHPINLQAGLFVKTFRVYQYFVLKNEVSEHIFENVYYKRTLKKPKSPLLTISGKALKITRQTRFSTTKIQEDIKDAEQSF